jgi:endoglucanase
MLGGLAACAFATAAHGQTTPASLRSATAAARLNTARRGFNLPGIGDTPVAEMRRIEPQALAALRKLGFDTIRLPVDPSLLIQDADQTALFRSALILSVEQILLAGFSLTLDMHPGGKSSDLLRRSPETGSRLIVDAWRALLPVCLDLPADLVMLEMLNEPALPSDQWLELRPKLVDLIRSRTDSHTLIWGAANYQTIEETIADQGPGDDNAIAAVHYYYPMIFTHQGQDWVEGPLKAIRGFPFPSRRDFPDIRNLRQRMMAQGHLDAAKMIDEETGIDWTPDRIDADMQRLQTWSAATGWPVIVNEFGVYRAGAREADRALWLKSLRSSAERCGFGWAHWEIDEGFGFMSDRNDPSSIQPRLIDALLGGDHG